MAELFSFLGLGVLYGCTMCSFTCLPYLGIYLMGTGQGFGDGVRASFFFLLGKVCTYTLFGALAGALGMVLDLSATQGKVLGLVLITTGIFLPFVARKQCQGTCRQSGKRLSLFSLGMATSLLPCPPLAAVFLVAAQKGSWLLGAGYGALFGLGLFVSPLLLAGGGLAHITKTIQFEAKGFTPYLQGISMLIIVVIGLRVFI
ncbi:MAG: sulfite exporter TauE/SafE family protein [Thermodesulfobacteriota bacterium]